MTVQLLPVNSLGEYSIYQIMLHFEQGFFTFLIGQLAREAITLIVIVSTKPRRALRTVPTLPNKFYSFLSLKSGTSFQTIICLFFEINLNSNLNVKKLSKTIYLSATAMGLMSLISITIPYLKSQQ